ncbi:MAG: hypothetical protein KIT73_17295, partial [Burkholderiales bacterium]|nr:hypothetical protein [Burkholderiales bacterium]
VDLRTFVLAKSPRSDNQFAAVVAYYYRFEAPFADRRDTIEGGVLQTAARLVGRKRLNNPRSTLNNAKASGYLDGVTPGEFAINGVGEKLVVRSLPTGDDDIVRPVRQRKAATRTETRGTPRRKTI